MGYEISTEMEWYENEVDSRNASGAGVSNNDIPSPTLGLALQRKSLALIMMKPSPPSHNLSR